MTSMHGATNTTERFDDWVFAPETMMSRPSSSLLTERVMRTVFRARSIHHRPPHRSSSVMMSIESAGNRCDCGLRGGVLQVFFEILTPVSFSSIVASSTPRPIPKGSSLGRFQVRLACQTPRRIPFASRHHQGPRQVDACRSGHRRTNCRHCVVGLR